MTAIPHADPDAPSRTLLSPCTQETFKAFHDENHGRLFWYLRSLRLQKETIEDIMQLVWQKAFMQSSAGTVEKINVAWLKKVAYREAIDLIRKDATRNKHIRADENIQQMESPESAVLEVSEHGENLKNCLDGLSEAERVVISKWSEGVKPVVIAEQAGKPAETIYKMVHHIKARLKVCMETKSGITHGERPTGGRS